uniref:Uncharacterized protein n=1 Tax=Macrostomum lignano TaxID=282301 RepID=A0A1I8FKG4_9PLAT
MSAATATPSTLRRWTALSPTLGELRLFHSAGTVECQAESEPCETPRLSGST